MSVHATVNCIRCKKTFDPNHSTLFIRGEFADSMCKDCTDVMLDDASIGQYIRLNFPEDYSTVLKEMGAKE